MNTMLQTHVLGLISVTYFSIPLSIFASSFEMTSLFFSTQLVAAEGILHGENTTSTKGPALVSRASLN